MADDAFVYVALILGFILLVMAIRYLPFGQVPAISPASIYYKFDLKGNKITAITFNIFKEETNKLFDKGYQLIGLPELKALIKYKTKLSENLFMVAVNNSFAQYVNDALPILIDEQINIIIFIPTFIVSSNNKYQNIQDQLIEHHFPRNPEK